MLTQIIGPLRAHITGGREGRGDGDGPVVVLLHGFGAPGTDLVGLASELRAPKDTCFVFPEAPLTADIGFGNFQARAWWQIDMMRLQVAAASRNFEAMSAHVPEGLETARAALNEFLDHLDGLLEIGDRPLVVGGFSQGAMLSTDLALRSDRSFSGLLLFSGTLIAKAEWETCLAKRAPLPFFQSHGRQDPVLPFSLAEELHRMLQKRDWPGTWVPFDGGHGIGGAALRGAGTFLEQLST